MMYKKVCEIGHWVDQQYGPREGVKQFKKGRESSALTLSLLAALEGYEVAQFNAAWMLMRGKAMEEANIAFAIKPKKERKARYETASAVLLSLIHQNTRNSEASILLGDIYMGGHQIPHNQNLSAQLYEAAAEEGNVVGTSVCYITSSHSCYVVLCCVELSSAVFVGLHLIYPSVYSFIIHLSMYRSMMYFCLPHLFPFTSFHIRYGALCPTTSQWERSAV